MNYADAYKVAESLMEELAPLCERIEVVGSIRRRRANVNDIDLVLIPLPYQLVNVKQRLVTVNGGKLAKAGDKYLMLANYRGIQVDVYIASLFTWATLLLIRTGSKNHNIFLARQAQKMGYKLNADGHGLTWISKNVNVHCPTEEALFEKLGLPYKEPWERE